MRLSKLLQGYDAPIVLFDEATASLDVENEAKAQGALSRLLAGKTVLVSSSCARTDAQPMAMAELTKRERAVVDLLCVGLSPEHAAAAPGPGWYVCGYASRTTANCKALDLINATASGCGMP